MLSSSSSASSTSTSPSTFLPNGVAAKEVEEKVEDPNPEAVAGLVNEDENPPTEKASSFLEEVSNSGNFEGNSTFLGFSTSLMGESKENEEVDVLSVEPKAVDLVEEGKEEDPKERLLLSSPKLDVPKAEATSSSSSSSSTISASSFSVLSVLIPKLELFAPKDVLAVEENPPNPEEKGVVVFPEASASSSSFGSSFLNEEPKEDPEAAPNDPEKGLEVESPKPNEGFSSFPSPFLEENELNPAEEPKGVDPAPNDEVFPDLGSPNDEEPNEKLPPKAGTVLPTLLFSCESFSTEPPNEEEKAPLPKAGLSEVEKGEEVKPDMFSFCEKYAVCDVIRVSSVKCTETNAKDVQCRTEWF